MQHGFPHRASALAWDPLLRLAALGTATGALKVYGRPGVELYGQHSDPDLTVTQIKFIPGKWINRRHQRDDRTGMDATSAGSENGRRKIKSMPS